MITNKELAEILLKNPDNTPMIHDRLEGVAYPIDKDEISTHEDETHLN